MLDRAYGGAVNGWQRFGRKLFLVAAERHVTLG